MKKIKQLSLLALLMLTVAAFAQAENTDNNRSRLRNAFRQSGSRSQVKTPNQTKPSQAEPSRTKHTATQCRCETTIG